MAVFRFRAQPALDLRRSQDEEAQRALGAAKRAVREAEQALEAAIAELRAAISAASVTGSTSRAGASAAALAGAADDVALLTWHRNWITSREQHAETARQRLDERRAEASQAAAAAQRARQRLRSLERLRDRALRAHLDAERRHEQRQLDALGTMQYASRRLSEEERA